MRCYAIQIHVYFTLLDDNDDDDDADDDDDDATQVITRIDTVFNVVIPWIIIASVSVASLVRLICTARPSIQAITQSEMETEYIRSTVIAQLSASLTFVAFGLPAEVHQLSVMLADSQSAPALDTYMTQRLLLVVLYSRCSSTFFVHVAANRCFRRRLTSLIRRRPNCCGRGRSAPVDISMSLATWSPDAASDRPPINSDGQHCFTMV